VGTLRWISCDSFNFFQKIKSNALSAISVVKNLPFKIDKIDKLKETWMGHEMMIRKLNNIYSKKTIEKIKLKNIENLISRGILKGVTAKKEKDGKLLLSSEDPWKILNILDDDYVRSLLTGINYEEKNKKQIQINNH
jgi:hypothetical protein